MDSKIKTSFTSLDKSDDFFSKIIKKITLGEKLNNNEYSYILALSLIAFDNYKETNRNGYLEFSYYLVLNYSLKTGDYSPLLTFSVNNGLYPIAKAILTRIEKNIYDTIIEGGINFFKKDKIYELKKQFETRKALIESDAQNRAYVAPTSYGKSTTIIEDIKLNQRGKIGIIVPKRALIWQTFKSVKNIARELKYKVLLHDTEYNNEDRIICIFTQERAIRLLQDSGVPFDVMYIDEAHNLFEKDERNVLLARLIKLNKKMNPLHRIIYLSPLIKDANDLLQSNDELIEMHRIDFNIKELNITLFNKNGTVEVYNRFVNRYYDKGTKYDNYLKYIVEFSKKKNLLYFNTPKDVEFFSQEILNFIKRSKHSFPNVESDEDINEVIKNIIKYVDKDYYLVELLKYGVIYIHGKMPDSIKDYLLNRFINIPKLKYLVSNSSILEGMNLSIDTLFIMDSYGLNRNDLFNLCGRINRLNDVFSDNELRRLMCDVFFIDRPGNKYNVKTKIEMFRSDEEDNVKNPMLINAKTDEKGKKIAEQENEFIDHYQDKEIKNIFIKNGISSMFVDLDIVANNIEKEKKDGKFLKCGIIEKISKLFFCDPGNVTDYELARLAHPEAVMFYTLYVSHIYHKDLKRKVAFFKSYFDKTIGYKVYIGSSFGEIPSEFNPNKNVYLLMNNKTDIEKANYAIIKSKIEDDFIGFKIGKLVKTLYDLKIITEEEYNIFIYGTNDKKKLELVKMGLPPIILNFIEDNGLSDDFNIETGVIQISDRFKEVLSHQDGYIKFEMEKYIF